MAEYCLRWNNHQPNLVTVFSELLTAESLVDVTLAADGHFIHAHRLVLSACSVYFKDLFNGTNSWKHPIVFLKDIRIEDLKTVIDFIYRGEVNVSQERLQDVLKTAESLRIKGLADKPFNYDDYPSQARAQHLSSSFSSQRSSLTDSREQMLSVDADDAAEVSSPPQSKKRKLTSQESLESAQDSNHENEERLKNSDPKENTSKTGSTNTEERSKTPSITIKQKIKEENNDSPSATDVQAECQESRAADAMLLLQGSSSDGGGDDGGTPPTSGGGGSTNSLREGTGLISPHAQEFVLSGTGGARGKRGTLQRQTGIRSEGLAEEPLEIGTQPPEFIHSDLPTTVTLTVSSTSFPHSSTTLTCSSGAIDLNRESPSLTSSSKKHLQVPAVVVSSGEKTVMTTMPSYSSLIQKQFSQGNKPLLVVPSSSSGPCQMTKQRSQPEMSRSYSTGPPTIKKQPSQPSVLSYTTSSSGLHEYSPSLTTSSSNSQGMTFIPMQLVKKQKSMPGSSSPNASHLRPIQPKPSLYDRELPQFQLTVSDEESNYTTRLPRAISEEPIITRGQCIELLTPGPSTLTQSVSQDTGLDGGIAILNRFVPSTTQSLNVSRLTPSSSSVAHSPVLREGPALGCNYCWNSQDNQGRVQRRKTKYHCPACRTNLCIVPCFHEYHSQMQMQQDQHKQFTKVVTKTNST